MEFHALKAINAKKEGHFFTDLVEHISMLPPQELERIHRLASLEMTYLRATHPPTKNRIAFIRALPGSEAGFQLTQERHRNIVIELSLLQADIEKRLLDNYRNLYFYV